MKKKKIALIFGISGQDGSYLTHLLLKKKYAVIGITRKKTNKNLFRLINLKIINKIKILKGSALNVKFLQKLIKNNYNIREIYYLAGDSSVVNSFKRPDLSLTSNTFGILNILTSVKNLNKKIKIYNAASGQFFGNNKKKLF